MFLIYLNEIHLCGCLTSRTTSIEVYEWLEGRLAYSVIRHRSLSLCRCGINLTTSILMTKSISKRSQCKEGRWTKARVDATLSNPGLLI